MKIFVSLFETIRADEEKKLMLKVSELMMPVLVTAILPFLCCEFCLFSAVQHRDDTGTKKLGLLVAKELERSFICKMKRCKFQELQSQ